MAGYERRDRCHPLCDRLDRGGQDPNRTSGGAPIMGERELSGLGASLLQRNADGLGLMAISG